MTSGDRPGADADEWDHVSVTTRFDRFQQSHPLVGYPIAVAYKFFDDMGGFLAALITYYGFLSIFPLLLIASSVLGFLLQDNPDLKQQILDSAIGQFPVIGTQLGDPRGLQGSVTAVVIGLAGSLYGALGVAQAVQNAMNVAWAVPRNRRPNPFLSRFKSLILLAAGAATLVATGFLSQYVDRYTPLGIGAQLLALAINATFFGFVFKTSTAREVAVRDVLPGAIVAAILWQILQDRGAAFVTEVVSRMDTTNGAFAIVLGLIAWIYLAALAMLLCAEANVVAARRLYPRTLLTPFTDDVDLTDADRRAYTSYAVAQRNKGFEQVDVSFEHDGQYATAKRLRRAARRAAEKRAGEQRAASGGGPVTPGGATAVGRDGAVFRDAHVDGDGAVSRDGQEQKDDEGSASTSS